MSIMFAKRHYEAIAEAIKHTQFKDEWDRQELIVRLAGTFSSDNPNFKFSRFKEAATPKQKDG